MYDLICDSKRLLLIFVFLLATGQECCARQGLDLLKETIAHSPDAVIRTGEFSFELSIKDKELSSEELENVARHANEKFAKILARRPELKPTVDIPPGEKFVARYKQRKRDATNRRLRYVYVHSGPSLGGDRFVEFSSFNKEKGAFDKPKEFVFRGGSSENILNKPGMSVVGDKAFFICQDPQSLGRITGFAGLLADVPPEEFESQVGNVSQTRVEGVYAQEAWKLTFTSPSTVGEVEVSCHVIPERGFIVPLLSESRNGKVVREWKSEGYFQPAGSEIWFPEKCNYTNWNAESGEIDRIETYNFDRASVLINHQIPDERFSVAIPKGSMVLDSRTNPGVNYIADDRLDFSLDDIDDLSSNAAMSKFTGNENGVDSRGSHFAFWAFGFLTLAASVLIVRRFIKQK